MSKKNPEPRFTPKKLNKIGIWTIRILDKRSVNLYISRINLVNLSPVTLEPFDIINKSFQILYMLTIAHYMLHFFNYKILLNYNILSLSVCFANLFYFNKLHENPAVIMERVLKEHDIPEDKRVLLYTYIRLAHSFPNYEKRKLFVQTRLQSLSILVYSGAIQEHANNLLYDGLIEELVDLLTIKDTSSIPPFPEIKAASLKTLTAIIHLEKTNKLTEIIETTQAGSYHGLLPTLVRKCVDHLIDPTKEPFPHQFATSLFSFLYHLATYDTGGDALVKCGIMETLLKVVNHNHNSQEFIMFVTRAVRVIDLITNLDMSSFEAHNGLTAFINRLEYEVNECRKEQPFVIQVKSSVPNKIEDENEIEISEQNSEMNAQESSMEPVTPSVAQTNEKITSAEGKFIRSNLFLNAS